MKILLTYIVIKHCVNIYSYKMCQFDNVKIWCFDINNEINFHKKKISATRVEQSQPLMPVIVSGSDSWSRYFFMIINHFFNYSYILHFYDRYRRIQCWHCMFGMKLTVLSVDWLAAVHQRCTLISSSTLISSCTLISSSTLFSSCSLISSCTLISSSTLISSCTLISSSTLISSAIRFLDIQIHIE